MKKNSHYASNVEMQSKSAFAYVHTAASETSASAPFLRLQPVVKKIKHILNNQQTIGHL